jgi:hypothetical protein
LLDRGKGFPEALDCAKWRESAVTYSRRDDSDELTLTKTRRAGI